MTTALQTIPGLGLAGAAQGADVSSTSSTVTYIAPAQMVTLDQHVVEYIAPTQMVTIQQWVGKILAPAQMVTLDQTVYGHESMPPAQRVTFVQQVVSYIPPQQLITLQQMVRSVVDVTQPHQYWRVYLDGVDITSVTSLDITITASEGQAQTAIFRFKPDIGDIDIPGLQRRKVKIARYIDGVYTVLYTGWVDRPVYDYSTRSITCNCSDMRSTRLDSEDYDTIQAMTGGIYSDIVQDSDATGADKIDELMDTVLGTLQYDRRGILRYTPWEIGTPKYTLVNGNVRRSDLSFSFAEGSSIVNSIDISVSYRYYRLRARKIDADVGITMEDVITAEYNFLPKESLVSAFSSLSNWLLGEYEFDELPDPGYIWINGTRTYFTPISRTVTGTETVTDEDGETTTNVTSTATVDARDYYALGIEAELIRYIAQPITETYTITVTAPESIDQFDEIEGTSQQHAIETDYEYSTWEDKEDTTWPPADTTESAAHDMIRYEDDKRDELETALQAAWLIAQKEILSSHRANYVTYIHDGAGSDHVLPVDIGDTIQLVTDVVDCTGNVSSYTHSQSSDGISQTKITLALSYVSSDHHHQHQLEPAGRADDTGAEPQRDHQRDRHPHRGRGGDHRAGGG